MRADEHGARAKSRRHPVANRSPAKRRSGDRSRRPPFKLHRVHRAHFTPRCSARPVRRPTGHAPRCGRWRCGAAARGWARRC
eukprot:scaffold4112_cov110-Isochrysis_galbana.AAC.2